LIAFCDGGGPISSSPFVGALRLLNHRSVAFIFAASLVDVLSVFSLSFYFADG